METSTLHKECSYLITSDNLTTPDTILLIPLASSIAPMYILSIVLMIFDRRKTLASYESQFMVYHQIFFQEIHINPIQLNSFPRHVSYYGNMHRIRKHAKVASLSILFMT